MCSRILYLDLTGVLVVLPNKETFIQIESYCNHNVVYFSILIWTQRYSRCFISINPQPFFKIRCFFNQITKGQLISECLFGVLNFPKKHQRIWQISALESKKWSNHKIKAHYNDFDTNYVQTILNREEGAFILLSLFIF